MATTRRDIRAITREVEGLPAAPSFLAVSCSLPSPEGRLGVCAWALRGPL